METIYDTLTRKGKTMGLILLILLVVLLLGAAPAWPYSRRWGYGPSGLLGIMMLILLVLLILDVLPWGEPWIYR